jgi:TRAP-type transport system small permease protein
MRLHSPFLAFDRAVVAVLNVALVLTLSVCVVAGLVQVSARLLPMLPIYVAWPDEMARGSMAWMTFLGAAVLVKRREHIQLGVLGLISTGTVGVLRRLVSDLVVIASLVIVTYTAVNVVASDFAVSMATIPASSAVMSGSILVGTVGQLYFATVMLVGTLGTLVGKHRAQRST